MCGVLRQPFPELGSTPPSVAAIGEFLAPLAGTVLVHLAEMVKHPIPPLTRTNHTGWGASRRTTGVEPNLAERLQTVFNAFRVYSATRAPSPRPLGPEGRGGGGGRSPLLSSSNLRRRRVLPLPRFACDGGLASFGWDLHPSVRVPPRQSYAPHLNHRGEPGPRAAPGQASRHLPVPRREGPLPVHTGPAELSPFVSPGGSHTRVQIASRAAAGSPAVFGGPSDCTDAARAAT